MLSGFRMKFLSFIFIFFLIQGYSNDKSSSENQENKKNNCDSFMKNINYEYFTHKIGEINYDNFFDKICKNCNDFTDKICEFDNNLYDFLKNHSFIYEKDLFHMVSAMSLLMILNRGRKTFFLGLGYIVWNKLNQKYSNEYETFFQKLPKKSIILQDENESKEIK